MCTYNGARFLREQLDSIVSQTYPIHELLVQDDCSTDDTCEIVMEYAARYPYIRLERNERQRGVNLNFFDAMRKTTGDYIAISDQDDIWETNKLALQADAIGEKLLVSGISQPFVEGNTAVTHDTRQPNYSLLRILYVGPLLGHTLFFKKELLSLLPDLTEMINLRYYDAILSMVAAAYDGVVYIGDCVLVHQRRHLSASTYHKPVDNRFTLSNVRAHLVRTFGYYKELRPEMARRFAAMHRFLSAIDYESKTLSAAVRMADLQSQSTLGAYIALTVECVVHHNDLFYTKEGSRLMRFLRSFYFPISCSDYFRYLSKNYNNK